jgi:hypothetical protein
MKYKIIDEKDSYLIREHLRNIRNILFDDDNSLKEHIGGITKTKLTKSLDYLEKEKDSLPDSCRREMDSILKRVRQIISDRYRIL